MSQNDHPDKSGGSAHAEHSHSNVHHVLPLKIYYRVWITLLVFTVLTVLISYVDFGPMNLLIAMVVATIKATLVMAFFMGLKYDVLENRLAFLGSFAFLGIFVVMTWCDIFFRPAVDAAIVDKSNAPAQMSGPVDAKKMMAGSAEMTAKGKELYGQNCVTCHGAAGMGDGPAATALNPKPRNFTADAGWKNGRKLTQIFTTLTNGLPGTPMPSFAGISVEDRFALAHYVQALGPKAPEASDADVASLGLGNNAQAKPEITVEEAMNLYVGSKGTTTKDVASQGMTPRQQYCDLSAPWRPRWCDVNGSDPAAH